MDKGCTVDMYGGCKALYVVCAERGVLWDVVVVVVVVLCLDGRPMDVRSISVRSALAVLRPKLLLLMHTFRLMLIRRIVASNRAQHTKLVHSLTRQP